MTLYCLKVRGCVFTAWHAGKSTLLKICEAMYNGNHAIVGILQNNPEENFGLQTLQGTRLVLSTEVDKSFSLPPTTFNQVQSFLRSLF